MRSGHMKTGLNLTFWEGINQTFPSVSHRFSPFCTSGNLPLLPGFRRGWTESVGKMRMLRKVLFWWVLRVITVTSWFMWGFEQDLSGNYQHFREITVKRGS